MPETTNLTYKIKHGLDLTKELSAARKVAQYAIAIFMIMSWV